MERNTKYIRLGDYLMASRRIESIEMDTDNNALIVGMASGSNLEVISQSKEECQRMFRYVSSVLNGSDGNTLFEDKSCGESQARYNAIDLGLPSGLLWADRNVGAETPEGCGHYFAWGEVEGYGQDTSDGHLFNWYTCPWGKSTPPMNTLDAEHDAATQNMGADWRMPDERDFDELLNNCKTEWAIQNGVNGRLFTSKVNGNTLFFPAAGYRNGSSLYDAGSNGYVWSRSLYSSYDAYYLYFGSSNCYSNYYYRCDGHSVRGVRSK